MVLKEFLYQFKGMYCSAQCGPLPDGCGFSLLGFQKIVDVETIDTIDLYVITGLDYVTCF